MHPYKHWLNLLLKRGSHLYLALLIAVLYSRQAPAQMIMKSRISVGSQMPDLPLGIWINAAHPLNHISDYKGKLLILDFWASWCGACIDMLVKGDSLEKAFHGQVVFVPIDYEAAPVAQKMLDAIERVRHLRIPSVVGDTVFIHLFPHKSLPHYIMISPEGKVIAITEPEYINGPVLDSALRGLAIHVPVKTDVDMPYAEGYAFFWHDNGGDASTCSFRAILSGSTPLAESQFSAGASDPLKGRHLYLLNTSIGTLFEMAYGENRPEYLSGNRTLWKVRQPDILRKPQSDPDSSWFREHAYCYDLVVPPALNDSVFSLMRQDLDRYFGAGMHIRAHFVQRKAPCLVLVRTASSGKLLRSGAGPAMATVSSDHIVLQRKPLSLLMNYLRLYPYRNRGLPLVDATGVLQPVSMDLQCQAADLGSLNRALHAYGLEFRKEIRPVRMLVISQNRLPERSLPDKLPYFNYHQEGSD